MNFLENIILGLVQGITEFLPVSSSGHLWVFEELIFRQKASLVLEAFLHFATLLAVIIFFRKKLWQLIKNFFTPSGEQKEKILVWKLGVATVCTVPVALFFKPIVENQLNREVVMGTLLITGLMILFAEYFAPKEKVSFSWPIAIFLGLAQGIAVMPGISRSGLTIVFLILAGIRKKEAVEISFLLAIPTILGAFLFLLPEINSVEARFIVPLLAGGLTAFFAAMLAIWWMLKWVQKYWKYFAVWCFAVALGLMFL